MSLELAYKPPVGLSTPSSLSQISDPTGKTAWSSDGVSKEDEDMSSGSKIALVKYSL
jgi:hypothetical protein